MPLVYLFLKDLSLMHTGAWRHMMKNLPIEINGHKTQNVDNLHPRAYAGMHLRVHTSTSVYLCTDKFLSNVNCV